MTAAARARALAPVPCPDCRRDMPAGRLAPALLATTNGVCGTCSTAQRIAARVEPPMYETDAWSRGIRLD